MRMLAIAALQEAKTHSMSSGGKSDSSPRSLSPPPAMRMPPLPSPPTCAKPSPGAKPARSAPESKAEKAARARARNARNQQLHRQRQKASAHIVHLHVWKWRGPLRRGPGDTGIVVGIVPTVMHAVLRHARAGRGWILLISRGWMLRGWSHCRTALRAWRRCAWSCAARSATWPCRRLGCVTTAHVRRQQRRASCSCRAARSTARQPRSARSPGSCHAPLICPHSFLPFHGAQRCCMPCNSYVIFTRSCCVWLVQVGTPAPGTPPPAPLHDLGGPVPGSPTAAATFSKFAALFSSISEGEPLRCLVFPPCHGVGRI